MAALGRTIDPAVLLHCATAQQQLSSTIALHMRLLLYSQMCSTVLLMHTQHAAAIASAILTRIN
jgi:hypothetical protein